MRDMFELYWEILVKKKKKGGLNLKQPPPPNFFFFKNKMITISSKLEIFYIIYCFIIQREYNINRMQFTMQNILNWV